MEPNVPQEVRVVSKPWKAVYAVVMAALVAAGGIYQANVWLTIALAALTPLGVYLIDNQPEAKTVKRRV